MNLMNLQQRIKKIEIAARPMIDEREQWINSYIAEYESLGGEEMTHAEAEHAHDFIHREIANLEHLPRPERYKRAAGIYAIDCYRQRTGATEDEAIEALKPLIPELCKA
jgi:hypothetical protein